MEINENNGASVDATYTWPIHLGTFALNLKAADTKDRLHEREVRLASTFGQILDRECGDAKGLEGEDNRIPSRYPIEGRIGIAEVVNQYFTVQRNAEFAAKEGYFGSLIRFTTDLTGSVTPTFKVAPLPQEMLEASGMIGGGRKDIHEVTIRIVPPAKPSAVVDKITKVQIVGNDGSLLPQ
ncbi:MAG: hypothetical protein AAGD43_10320 [Pseudomonadota bacterium]